ncbi:MAG: class I adenylate-forming enzyme family protein [Acidimicrobiales bacterium]
MRSYQEAMAEVAAPGQPFEVVTVDVDGVSQRVFMNSPTTVRQFFDLARGVEATFLVYEDEEWTFARVMDEVDALGHALVHHYDVKRGDRVGIAMRNYPEWVISFAAILSVGAISVSLNAWWTEEELDYAINDSELSLLIADDERVKRALRSCERTGTRLLGVRLLEGSLPALVESWSDVVVKGNAMPEVELDADTDATILYTSGTTGSPKGAVSTHGAICQTIMAFSSSAQIQTLRRNDQQEVSGLAPCFILIVPLFHVTGCIPVMMSCFAWHFKLVMMYRWDADRALALIERHRVTAFVGVPTQAWDLMESPDFSKHDTSSLATVGGGGAPAPATLVARVERNFSHGRPSLGYGLTETNAYGPQNFGEDYVTHPTSTGRVPTIVMDVDIRDESARSVPAGESGEIWMKSPTLIRRYWRQPKATAVTLVNGWLRTGDLGHVSVEGFLFVEDRAKDMIIRAGENVYSAQVESAIYENPRVYEAAVLGLGHERLGEEVAAVVMVRDGMDLTSEDLRTFLSSRLAAYMIPSRIAFTREPLPRNPAGKLMKREMPEIYFSSAS